MLAEIDFDHKKMTEEIVALIRGYSRSWLSSLINEDGFNHLRGQALNHSAGQMGREARWGNLALSSLLAKHGRKTFEITPVARQNGPGRVPESSFVATNTKDFSLGTDVLHEMGGKKWVDTSVPNDKLVGAMWKAFQLCDGDMRLIQKCWLALLASPGVVLLSSEPPHFRLVLASNQWLVLYQPLRTITLKDTQKILIPNMNSGPKATVLTAWQGVRVVRVRAISPAKVAKEAENSDTARGIAFMKLRAASSLAECAAREGFRQLNKPYLDKLLALQRIDWKKGRKPKTLVDAVKFLVRHFIPSASAEEIAEAGANRDQMHLQREVAECSVLAKGDNLAAMADCIASDDEEFVANTVANAKKLVSEDQPQQVSGNPKEWIRKPVDPSMSYTLAEARKMIPQVRGCKLDLDQKRFHRWKLYYPRRTWPKNKTQAYGDGTGLNETEALIACLKQGWAWHLEATGKECPYDFSIVQA